MAQKLRLAMMEPILEISIFGGFSCNIDMLNKSDTDVNNADDERKTFSAVENSLDDDQVTVDIKKNYELNNETSSLLLINESEALTMRLLQEFYTSKIIFELSVLCGGKINTEILQLPHVEDRKPKKVNESYKVFSSDNNIGNDNLYQHINQKINNSCDKKYSRTNSLSAMISKFYNNKISFKRASLAENSMVKNIKSRFSKLSLGYDKGNFAGANRRRSSSIIKLVGQFLSSKFGHSNRRIFHAPKISALAYEIASASYFPVSRFIVPKVTSDNDYVNIDEVEYNMAMIAPNWVARFARTCIPMLIGPTSQSYSQPSFYSSQSFYNSYEFSQPFIVPTFKIQDVYDNFNYQRRYSDPLDTCISSSYLTLSFGSTRQLLNAIFLNNHEKKRPDWQKIIISNDLQESDNYLKTQLNIEIEIQGACKRLNQLLNLTTSKNNFNLNENSPYNLLLEAYIYPDSDLAFDKEFTQNNYLPKNFSNKMETFPGEFQTEGKNEAETDNGKIFSCALEFVRRSENGLLGQRLGQEIAAALKYLKFDLSSPARSPINLKNIANGLQNTEDSCNNISEEGIHIKDYKPYTVCYDLDALGRWNIVIDPCITIL
ncbi:unnamed protein product [Gordionus sp. m RMFG-2023]